MQEFDSYVEDTMPHWRTDLKKLTREGLTGTDYRKIVQALIKTESDRGCVLIGQSLTEKCLELIIQKRMVDFSDKDYESLFGFDAPLGTFSAKIKLAQAFGMIDGDVRADLDQMRDIRNAFAHHPGFLTFENDAVRRGCAGFIAPDPHVEILDPNDPDQSTSRSKFINVIVMFLCLTVYDGLFHSVIEKKDGREPLNYKIASSWRRDFGKELEKQVLKNINRTKKAVSSKPPPGSSIQ